MRAPHRDPRASDAGWSRQASGLLPLVVASGAAALIYEVVWFQQIELVIGSTAASLAVVLGTFMGGLCAGSLAFPRLVSSRRHPLLVYAAIEAGTGAVALALAVVLPALGGIYAAVAPPGFGGLVVRALLAALCLLPPTILMGATFPAVARWLDSSPRGMARLGVFYGGNIAGAVAGALAAGFYLLPEHDLLTATWVAVTLNGVVAAVAYGVGQKGEGRREKGGIPGRGGETHDPQLSTGTLHLPSPVSQLAAVQPRAALMAIACSGAAALGAEVAWTRLLALDLGPTVYTFSIVLAVFLAGLGGGAFVGSGISRETQRPLLALAVCQLLLPFAIVWAARGVSTPPAPVGVAEPGMGFTWVAPTAALMRAFRDLFPATLLWGASFPLALAAASRRGADPARVAARVAASNTLGAIVGAVGCSMVAIPLGGTQVAQRLLIVLSAAGGAVALAAVVRGGGTLDAGTRAGVARAGRARARIGWLPASTAAAVLVLLLAPAVPPVSPTLVAYGRNRARVKDLKRVLFLGEGANSSVAVTERADGMRAFHVAGKVEASTDPQDLRLERMLAHFPALLHPAPRSVLVVGFGAGITAGTFLMYPGIERIVICEIEPIIPPNVGPFFARENLGVLRDPRVEIVYDDARHFVRTTREKFDIITSDPIHPWVRGSATLYTREYLQMVKRLLNPGGVVSEWAPLYENREDAVQSEVATFLAVFPRGTLWGSRPGVGGGYDLILVARETDARIDVDALQRRIADPEYLPVVHSLVASGFGSPLDLFSTFAGDRTTMAAWLEGAPLNLDRNLRLQYLAGLRSPPSGHEDTYAHLVARRALPAELFSASADWLAQLRPILER